MRIVHVVQSLGLGGQERLVLHLSRELRRRGHDVTVISLTPGGALRPDFEAPGGDPNAPTAVRVIELARREGFDARLPVRLAATLVSLKPDVVHTHNPSPMLYAVPIAKGLGVHAIVHTKHGANIYGSRSLRAAQAIARLTTSFVACSKGTAVTARNKERVPPRRLRVIPNGIPLGDFDPMRSARVRMRESLGLPQDAFVIGTVGRLAPEKAQSLLIAAAAPLFARARTSSSSVKGRSVPRSRRSPKSTRRTCIFSAFAPTCPTCSRRSTSSRSRRRPRGSRS